MAAPDFGTDFSAVDDLDPNMRTISGRQVLKEACARRLSTPRGGLWYAPNYGDDVRRYLNSNTDPRVIEQTAAAELAQDDRVESVSVSVTFDEEQGTFTLDVALTDAEGPFEFTLAVDSLTAKILGVTS